MRALAQDGLTEEALVATVAELLPAGDGADELAIAVRLETLGVNDSSARELGAGDVFALARQLLPQIVEARRALPELTVAMPVWNRETLVGESLRRVLAEEDVDFEVIVLDDGSTDGTARVVESFSDPRIRFERSPVNRGIGQSHQRILELARAPFLAHVDSDDLILPGGLRRTLDLARSDRRLGQVHAFYYSVDAEGRAHRGEWRRRRREFNSRRRSLDYRRALLDTGSVMNSLRTYRSSAVREVGGFDLTADGGGDYDIALRLLERFEIRALPEFLYCLRQHAGRTSVPSGRPGLRYWWRSVKQVRRLVLDGAITYPRRLHYRLLLLGRGLGLLLPPRVRAMGRRAVARVRGALGRAARRWGRGSHRLVQRLLAPLAPALTSSRGRPSVGPGPAVYHLWRFPALSQTFVQREIGALRDAGVDVRVVADGADDRETLGREAVELASLATYLVELPSRREALSMMRRRPLGAIAAILGVLGTEYDGTKSPAEDRTVISRAFALARILIDTGAGVVHSPWADRSALVARAAARIAGVAYTVQARAHDLYRQPSLPLLRGNLRAARHVVTNAEYNRPRIESLVDGAGRPRLHVEYEGLDPRQFEPRRDARRGGGDALRILCVARLIEEKGLVHLLRACALLRGLGQAFECRVVGGTEEPLYTNYRIELMLLHRSLRLETSVSFTGALAFEEVRRAYEWADLFVLPCVEASNGGRDVTPNVVMEAMASGLPVVSTRSGAIPELVRRGEGILVEPGDAQALASAIQDLATDPELRAALGAAARRAAEERFDVSRNIRTYVDVLTRDGGEAARGG